MSFLTEWNQEKVLAQERLDSENRGVMRTNERVAIDMLREKLPLPLIAKISKLSEKAILALAKTIK